ncbi:MAG: hypothetical protein U9R54_03575 [Bacteroidota bacterium]|nr:hypothetical protein [Bacteroidota bacterium]
MYRFLLFTVLLIIISNFSLIGQVSYPEKDSLEINKDTLVVTDAENVSDTISKKVEKKEIIPENTDVIYLHSGKKRYLNVKKVYLNDLYYSLPGKTDVEKMDQRFVYKIEYKTGKVEVLNEDMPEIRKVSDWRKVKITKEENNVVGLLEVSRIEAKAEGSERGYSTPSSLERSAKIILKRKAALINAHIVLIIDKKSYFAFGEIPSVTVIGIAYRYE